MKKLLTISLLTLAMVLLVVSCNAEKNVVEDELAVISFDASESTARSLTRTNPSFDASKLYWNYTAEKKDNTGLITGQTKTNDELTPTAVNETYSGLKTVGPFSYGKWKFCLYGYLDSNKTKLAYQGDAEITINKQTTNLKVYVTANQTDNGKGYLEFPAKNSMVKLIKSDSAVTLGEDIVEKITFDRLDKEGETFDSTEYNYSTMSTTNTNLRSKELSSGSYSVTFSYLMDVVVSGTGESATYETKDAYPVAEETIYVSIKDNQVTTIGGDITENTGEVNPTAVEPEAKIGDVYYDTLGDAVKTLTNAANKTATITILKEDVTLGNISDLLLGHHDIKTLGYRNWNSLNQYKITFVGNGASATTLRTRIDDTTHYNYIFGADITFQDMTVWIGYDVGTKRNANDLTSQGFVYADNLTFKNCDIEGLGSCWGKNNAFENCTFSTSEDWCMNIQEFNTTGGASGTDKSISFTFKDCTFSSGTGEFINVYENCTNKNTTVENDEDCAYKDAVFNITVENCTFNNTWTATSGKGNSGRAAVFLKAKFKDTCHYMNCNLTFKGTNNYNGTFDESKNYIPADGNEYKETYVTTWRSLFAVVEKDSDYVWSTNAKVKVMNGDTVIYQNSTSSAEEGEGQ